MPITAERRAELLKTAEKRAQAAAKSAGSKIGALALPGGTGPEVNPTVPMNEMGETPGAFIARTAQGTDDMVRNTANSATFGLADKAASHLPGGGTLDEELTKTRLSRERLGEGMSTVADVGGKVLQGMALPGSTMSTIPRAMGTSGVLAGAESLGQAFGKDQPLPSMGEVAVDTGAGVAAGAIGKYLGDRLGALWARKMTDGTVGSDTNLWKQAYDKLGLVKKDVDAAANAMKTSGVTVRSSYIQKEAKRLEDAMMKQITYRQGGRPATKEAIETFKRYGADGADVSLAELNEMRGVIRNSVLTNEGTISAPISFEDASLVRTIDRSIAKSISNLEKIPEAVGNGNIKQGVDGWRKMNELVPKQHKANLIAGVLDRADLAMKTSGMSYDRAVQQQFNILYKGKAGREFKGEEKEWIRKMAEGSDLTQLLNRFDRRYGHGFFSEIYNTINQIPRSGASKTAAENARGIFNRLSPQPVLSPSLVPGQLGASSARGVGSVLVGEGKENAENSNEKYIVRAKK